MFLDALLRTPSGGAYEQFTVAACLHAIIEEFGHGGVGGLRVETKNLNASDRSSQVAGDVQIVRGNRVEEAFEVTANNWRTKITQASEAAKSADLPRAHIIAPVEPSFPAQSEDLGRAASDLSALDIGAYLRTLIAMMRKPARATALRRLYEFLDRRQPEIERTNVYVRLLIAHGLATTP